MPLNESHGILVINTCPWLGLCAITKISCILYCDVTWKGVVFVYRHALQENCITEVLP